MQFTYLDPIKNQQKQGTVENFINDVSWCFKIGKKVVMKMVQDNYGKTVNSQELVDDKTPEQIG